MKRLARRVRSTPAPAKPTAAPASGTKRASVAAEKRSGAALREHRATADPALHERLSSIIGPALSPLFIFAPPRSGGALLRAALDRHPEVFAPQFDVPLGRMRANGDDPIVRRACRRFGLGPADLDQLLWDQLLRDQLARHGGSIIAITAPALPRQWRRLKPAFPAARFVFIVRDPATVWADVRRRATDPGAALTALVADLDAIQGARVRLPGLTIRYEDLLADPTATCTSVCAYLDIEFEADMVDALPGRGAALDRPSELPDELTGIAKAWGYA
jgi:sulfotransferase family protein